MYKVFKRKDRNTWGFKYKDNTVKGNWVKKSGFKTKSEAEAEAKKQMLEKSVIKKEVIAIDYLREWVVLNNKEETLSEKGFAHYKRALDEFEKHFGRKKMKDIKRSEYQKMLNNYGETRNRETVRKIHNPLSSMFKDAVYDSLIEKDPTYNVKLYGKNESKKAEDKFIEIDEYERLINYVKTKHATSYLAIYVAAITGARISEVLNITYEDLGKETIHLRGTKTETSDREIIIGEDNIKHIKKKVPHIKSGRLMNVSTNAIYKSLDKATNKLGIDKKVRPHALRHTHASYLIAKGFQIEYVSKRLGHANINITYDTYTHLLKEFEDENNNKIKELFKEF